MKKRKHSFHVIVEQDEEGYFVAECPSLRACYTQGKTYAEAIDDIKDVIVLCLQELLAQGKEVPSSPRIIGVQPVEVSI